MLYLNPTDAILKVFALWINHSQQQKHPQFFLTCVHCVLGTLPVLFLGFI